MPMQRLQQQHINHRHFMWVALLVTFALLLHPFHSCIADAGLPSPRSSSAIQFLSEHCPNASAGTCEICKPSDPSHNDGCEQLSEIAVLTSSSQHQPQYQAVTLAATVAIIPPIPQVMALSGCLYGRAEPPPTSFLSSSLRSSLSNRAPPISA